MNALNVSEPGAILAIVASGVFFMTGLLTGIWKWRQIMTTPERKAHIYVDIAHRTALMYSFSALLLAVFAGLSAWNETVNLIATALPLFFFFTAVALYVFHGIRRDTENQFEERNFVTTWGTGLLVIGEVGGFAVLFAGALRTLL